MSREEQLDRIIVIIPRTESVIPDKSPGICVDNKNGFVEGIQDYAVRRLFADTVYREKRIPETIRIERLQIDITIVEKRYDVLQPDGFHVIKA